MKTYAYIRVSTKDQKIDRQLAAIKPYALPKSRIYCDFQSGKNFERPAYQKLLRKLRREDLLIVKSIDRLGRNYQEILLQWQHITKEIGADILVLDMSLLDTRTRTDGLTGELIADLVLQILAYVAQTEREFIHQRQAEGIAAAKEKGVQFGRPALRLPEGFSVCAQRCREGKLSTRKAAQQLGVSHSTFYRWYKKAEESVSEYRIYETDNNNNIKRIDI